MCISLCFACKYEFTAPSPTPHVKIIMEILPVDARHINVNNFKTKFRFEQTAKTASEKCDVNENLTYIFFHFQWVFTGTDYLPQTMNFLF